MRVHFVHAPDVPQLQRQIISSLLDAHYKILMLAGAQGRQYETVEEASADALRGVQEYATQQFPELTIEVLPDAEDSH